MAQCFLTDFYEKSEAMVRQAVQSAMHIYEVALQWDSISQCGIIRSGNRMPVLFAAPIEFNGTDTVWSPEHLLVASISSCYLTTFNYFANLLKVELADVRVRGAVEIEKISGGGFWAKRFRIFPEIRFSNAQDPHVVDNLLSKAKRYCIVSNSVKGEVIVEPQIRYN